ncbi:MAG: phosphate ABC transporter substrate-binding protein [Phycisphaerae bacterium]
MTRIRRLPAPAMGLLACTLLAAGCRKEQQQTVNVAGSTSVHPYVELLAGEYQKKHPGRKVDVQAGGSAAGLKAALSGMADIGMCSRELKPEEAAQFNQVVIARDGVAVIVHPDNPVNALTTEQIRGMFSGRITNWKEVGGHDVPIRLVTREEGSGTREAFVHLVMGQEEILRGAMAQASNGALKAMVRTEPAAIGYMSLGQVGTDVKALRVDGQEPTAEGVLAGTYKLARPFLFVTKGPPGADAQAFIDYVLSPEGQKALEAEGFIRAR